jgi:hypothetical protein
MLTTQMSEKFILVKESKLAVFTNRMAFVTLIIGIANSSVTTEIASGVASSFRREYFEIVSANLAVMKLVVLSNVISQLCKFNEWCVVTLRAAFLQQQVESLLNLAIGKGDTILFLVESRAQLAVKCEERSNRLRENDLQSHRKIAISTFVYQICYATRAHFITARKNFSYLRQVLTTNWTLVLEAEATHSRGALKTNRMITRTRKVADSVKKKL